MQTTTAQRLIVTTEGKEATPASVMLSQSVKSSVCSPVRDNKEDTPASVILSQYSKFSVCRPVREDREDTPASVP